MEIKCLALFVLMVWNNGVHSQTAPPSSPTGVSATTVDSTSITLTWSQATEDDEVDSYIITYSFTVRECGTAGSGMFTVEDSCSRQHTLTNLQENSDVIITIRASNRAGDSQTVTTSTTTLTAAPSSPPENLMVSATTSTSITITWDRVSCDDRNIEITEHGVRYYPTSNPEAIMSSTLSDITNRVFTATGLIPRTNYTFLVDASHIDLTIRPIIYLFGPAATITGNTAIHEGVSFFLDGVLYPNNSVVTITNVGEGVTALYCLTDRVMCCGATDTEAGVGAGQWILSDGTVPTGSSTDNFYTNRGPSAVILSHRNGATGPAGVYTCIIPDGTGMDRTLYIGVGLEGSLAIVTDLSYNRIGPTLMCTSSGRPVDSVTWLKNGSEVNSQDFVQNQTITEATSATYQHTLSSGDISNFVGNFTCELTDVAGSTVRRSLTISGVTVTTVPSVFVVGSPGVANCSSDSGVAESRIEWLSAGGEVLASAASIQHLMLDFDPVNDSIHDSTYTCQVTRDENTPNQIISNQTLLLNITVPSDAISSSVSGSTMGVAGSEFTITCVVSEVASGLSDMPTAMWILDNEPVTNTDDITVISSANDTTATAVITFNPLRTFHDRTYTCRGTIGSPALTQLLIVDIEAEVMVQIPTPDVTSSIVTFDPLFAGSVEDVVLTCSASVDLSVFDTGTPLYSFTWLDRDGNELSSSSRTSISTTSTTSTLTLSPLSTTDTTFTCRVRVTEQQGTLPESEVGEANTTVNVQIPADPVVSMEARGTFTAGDTHTLTCNTTLTQDISGTMLIEWIAPDGARIENGTPEDVTVANSAFSSVLTFAPLHTSHGGVYVCRATLSNPEASLVISGNNSLSITIQIPMPTTIITGYPINEGFHSGINNFTFTGRLDFDPAVDTPLTLVPVWTKTNPASNFSDTSRFTIIGFLPLEGSATAYEVNLIIAILDRAQGDSGDYTLTVGITSIGFTSGTSVTTTRSIEVLAFLPQEVRVGPLTLPGGVPTAGDNYILECNITRAVTLSPMTLLEVMWLDPEGIPISTEDGISCTIAYHSSTTETILISTLTFRTLRTSHAGVYTCLANMTIPDIVTDHQVSKTTSVNITIFPATSVTIAPSRDGTLYLGTIAALVCTVTVDRTLVDTDIDPTLSFDGISDATRITTTISKLNDSTLKEEQTSVSYCQETMRQCTHVSHHYSHSPTLSS